MADMNQKDNVVATETEEIMVDNAEQAPITPHSKYSPNNHFEGQIQARKMADMNQKDDVIATETEEIMVDNAEQAPITPHFKYSPNNHFEDQSGVANKNESEMPEHRVPTNQPSSQMENEVIIDLQEMLLDRKGPPLSTPCCIYRVPRDIREQNVKFYSPKVVSIGPFHYGDPILQYMEKHKQIYFKGFISRTESSTILDEMVSWVKNSEQKIRACYSENIELSEKELVEVILVDAIFIIELFLRKGFGESSADDILQNPWFMGSIEVDLLLYENQLPFFILEELFDMSFGRLDPNPSSFLTFTLKFFWYYNTLDLEPENIRTPIKHFTDLFRSFHFPPNTIVDCRKQILKDARCHNLFQSASELNEAGVDLRANKDKCLLNLKFSKHVLEIPQILVDDSTEILFRNIIAFEQCHYSLEANIIGYLFFLDNLINTSKDVDVLVHNGIINNNLGDSNDVALLFNGLCKDILRVHIPQDYQDICKKLNDFCTNPWNKKMVSLKRDYCRTPWQTAASIAAIVLIILTIVQTICSIIQVVH